MAVVKPIKKSKMAVKKKQTLQFDTRPSTYRFGLIKHYKVEIGDRMGFGYIVI